jgi:chromosome segregation ATPase
VTAEDLKDAVDKALKTVRALQEELGEIETYCQDKTAALAALDARRQESSHKLDAACDALEAAAKTGEAEVKTAGDGAQHAMAAGRAAVEKESADAQQALAEADAQTDVLHGHVTEADAELKTRMAEVEQEVRTLQQQAHTEADEVTQATQAADQVLGEAAAELQRLLQEVTARSQQVRETLHTECAVPIQEEEEQANTRLGDLASAVDQSFGLASAHATDTAEFTVSERARELTEALDLVKDASGDLTKALETLRTRTAEAQRKAVEAADRLEHDLDEGTGSVEKALGHVDGVFEALSEMGFLP